VFFLWGCVCVCVCACVRARARARVCVRVLAMWNKALTQIISMREFKFWMILQGSGSRETTFIGETYVMYHQSLSRQAKSDSPTILYLGVKHPSPITAVVRMFRLIVTC